MKFAIGIAPEGTDLSLKDDEPKHPIETIREILGNKWNPLTKEEEEQMVEQSLRELEEDIAAVKKRLAEKAANDKIL